MIFLDKVEAPLLRIQILVPKGFYKFLFIRSIEWGWLLFSIISHETNSYLNLTLIQKYYSDLYSRSNKTYVRIFRRNYNCIRFSRNPVIWTSASPE